MTDSKSKLAGLQMALASLALMVLVGACGVKGNPLPPLTPPELGRGSPTFRRATQDLAFPNVAPVETVPEQKSGTRLDGRPEARPDTRPEDRP